MRNSSKIVGLSLDANRAIGQDEQTLTFVSVNLLYPGEGVDFHQGIRNADHVHPIQDTLPLEKTPTITTTIKYIRYLSYMMIDIRCFS